MAVFARVGLELGASRAQAEEPGGMAARVELLAEDEADPRGKRRVLHGQLAHGTRQDANRVAPQREHVPEP